MQSVTSFMETECLSDLSSEEVVRRLRERQREAAQVFGRLTMRERQVLQMVTNGLPNKAVASQLSLSIKTVEKHRGSIMRKLGLKSVCQLLYFWYSLTWDQSLEAG
jgi:DNA-binding NarL/FixJ family response regulator